MSKHTPGPWIVNYAGSAKNGESFKINEFYVYAPATKDDTAICADVIDPITQKPSEENARLIAAAPYILEVLQEIADGVFCDLKSVEEYAKKAIAKATGAA